MGVFFRTLTPSEMAAEFEQRLRTQQRILEDSHRNNARLRQVIKELTLTKSRRSRDVMLAEACGSLDAWVSQRGR